MLDGDGADMEKIAVTMAEMQIALDARLQA